jgi:hypothetical protein
MLITLSRSGDRPLAFEGERLDETTTRTNSGPTELRWWALALYRTQAGAPVLHVQYHTRWEGEQGASAVLIGTDDDDLAVQVRGFDPLQGATGLRRVQVAQDAKPDVRVQALHNAWDAGVGRVLQHLLPERIG